MNVTLEDGTITEEMYWAVTTPVGLFTLGYWQYHKLMDDLGVLKSTDPKIVEALLKQFKQD